MNSIEVSLKMETDAVTFYSEAADRTNYPVGRKMFLSIAEDEKRHIEMLNQLLRGLELTFKEASPVGQVKTIFEQMKDQMMQRVSATSDEMEAFKIAMQMEKEGAAFYRKAAAEASTEKEKKLFERLVREEEQHFAIFSNTYSFMKDTGNWFMWQEHSIVEG
ncbi:MAG: ferritin family protein [Nitrospirota bacterium]